MFTVVETFQQDEHSEPVSTCLTHVEDYEVARKEMRTAAAIPVAMHISEIYQYEIIRFKAICPICERDYTF